MGIQPRFPIVVALVCLSLALTVPGQEVETANKPTAVKVLEIGRAGNREFFRRMDQFWKTYDPETPLYIINYGIHREIRRRENIIINPGVRLPYHRSRITLVRGGIRRSGPGTVIWKVPPGAENPDP